MLFLTYSLLTSSQGVFPLAQKMEAFHIAPLATITDAAPVASLILLKSSYSKTSPLAITGIDSADTTSAISSHLARSLGLSLIFLPWTARAGTPVFSIRRANSTVSLGVFRRRILHVTVVSKFLRSVVRIYSVY
uniref:Uncharacterized protein n=1 Tax=Zea mays TaxID=4577 RepID=B8A2E6_MAIZE|nr:unknown [Zea mays]